MQNALWLNKILTEDGNLSKALTEEEIIELAKTITTANNFRILDGRRRIKFILKKVDEYLQSKSLITKTDINYFSNLNDIIFFANNFSRKTGSTKFIKIIPTLELNKDSRNFIEAREYKSTTENNRTALSLRIGTENFNPLGLKHQIDYGVAVNLSLGDFKRTYKEITNNIVTNDFILRGYPKSISIDYFVGYNFYPNTRTNIGCSFGGNFGFVKDNDGSDFTNALSLNLNANYFISYNTRLIFNLLTDYNQYSNFSNGNQRLNGSNLNFNFNTGLNISL